VTNFIDPDAIGPEKLELLYRVLEESFADVIAARPTSDPGIEMEIRIRLAQSIIGAFDRGVVDLERLRKIAVEGLAPRPEDIG
jgi:hypothetical protein